MSPEAQIFASAASGDAAVLTHLLEGQSRAVQLVDQYGVTPLMEACRFGHPRCVRLLVEAGSDVNACDKEGSTVLMHACAGAATARLVSYLLRHKAKTRKRDAYGCTALMRGAARGNAAIVRLLIEHGERVNAQSANDETPLTFAVVWNRPAVVRVLLEAGADLAWADRSGWTALQYALNDKNTRIARLLAGNSDHASGKEMK